MLSYRVKSKILIFISIIIFAAIFLYIVLKSLEDNVVYFFSPTDIYKKEDISSNKNIRIGGLVKENSVIKQKNTVNFIITDLNAEIIVNYTGIIPNLFSEGKGVIAEGILRDKKYFIAKKILAKHDENYMPPEIKKKLKINK